MPETYFNTSGYWATASLAGSDRAVLANGIIAELRKAGWGETLTYANATGTMGSLASDGNAVTLDSKVYTFKTTINNGNDGEVLIDPGASVPATVANFIAAVTLGAGAGTLYSTATSAHPSMTAAALPNPAQVWVYALTGGTPGNGYTTSGTFTWSTAVTIDGGSKMLCPATPNGLRFWALVYYTDSSTNVYIRVGAPEDSDLWHADAYGVLEILAGRYFEMITHKYDFWICVPGKRGAKKSFHAGTIRLLDTMVPNEITAATNSPNQDITAIADTTPIQVTIAGHGYVDDDQIYLHDSTVAGANGYWTITKDGDDAFTLNGSAAAGEGNDGQAQLQIIVTSAAHGMLTGEKVYIQRVEGNTNANGESVVTVIDANTYWLNDSYPNGDYENDPDALAVAANPRQIISCYWANQTIFDLTGGDGSWRNDLVTGSGATVQTTFISRINQYTVVHAGGTAPSHHEMAPRTAGKFYRNSRAIIYRPMVSFDRDIGGSTHSWVGELWDAVLINRAYSLDLLSSFEGYSWHQWFAASSHSLWLAYGEV